MIVLVNTPILQVADFAVPLRLAEASQLLWRRRVPEIALTTRTKMARHLAHGGTSSATWQTISLSPNLTSCKKTLFSGEEKCSDAKRGKSRGMSRAEKYVVMTRDEPTPPFDFAQGREPVERQMGVFHILLRDKK
jgi:hypothetical protein